MFPRSFGKFVLERELGRGGMSHVYLACVRGPGGFANWSVVKMLKDEFARDPEHRARFLDEAQVSARLNHANIAQTFEAGIEQDAAYMAMQFIAGVSLTELMRSGQSPARLSATEGAYVGIEVCKALDYAHRMGVVHRDITPRNIMIDEEGHVRIIDFGIASRMKDPKTDTFGSLGYMPPEQLLGDRPGPESDLFSLGVVLLEMWSGEALFPNDSRRAYEEALRGHIPSPSHSHPELTPLDALFRDLLSSDREARPARAEALGLALRSFAQGVDLVTTARALGERVRMVRETNDPSLAKMQTHAAFRIQKVPLPNQIQEDGPTTRAIPETRAIVTEAPPSPSRQKPRLVLIAAGLLVVGALLVFREKLSRSTAVAPADIGTGLILPIATQDGQLSQPSEFSQVSANPTTSRAIASATPSTSATARFAPTATAASTQAPTAAAQLAFVCTSGTRILVDGNARGACPQTISVKSGAHTVQLDFGPTGESRTEQILVEPNDRVRIRADFSKAVPEFRVSKD